MASKSGNPIPTIGDGEPYADSSRCGARLSKGGFCTQRAGHRTDHPGSGKCWLHGGAGGRPIKHGKYSRYDVIKSVEAKRLREHFEADPDPLNLLPDVLELRVRIADYCNRYDEYTEALLDWHASWTGEWDKVVEDWREEYRDWHAQYSELLDRVRDIRKNDRALAELEDPPVPPEPGDMAQKPRKVVDILQAGQFLGMVGGLIDKINRQETEGKITLLDVQHILKNYGLVALQVIEAEVENDDLRERLLVALDEGWDAIPIAKRERGSKIDT